MDWDIALVEDLAIAKRRAFIISALKALVFSSLLGLLFLYNMNRPRIMVLHSYDPTVDLVKDFENGIKKTLENEIEPLVETYYMNMLSKNTIKQKTNAGQDAKSAISVFKPRIIIAVGDEAQEFAAKFYVGRKKIRVIFCGVKGDFKKFGYDPGKNVAGILEVPPTAEINTVINNILPHKKNIRLAHLGDATTMVNLTEKLLAGHRWNNVQFIDSVKVSDFANFKKAATILNTRCDILLVSGYRGLQNVSGSEQESSEELMKWLVTNTSIPILSTIGYAVEEGAGIAILPSAYEQGRLAMQVALKIMKNMDILPCVSTNVFAVFLNDDHIKDRQLNIAPIYRSFAVSIKKIYSKDKKNQERND